MRLPRLRRSRTVADPDAELRRVVDSVPKDGLFTAPVRVERIETLPVEPLADGRARVTFRAQVRDADGKPCPDFAVEAWLSGPERSATGQATTDLLGRVRFRMAGPPGDYAVEITDVAAGGIAWDRAASQLHAQVSV